MQNSADFLKVQENSRDITKGFYLSKKFKTVLRFSTTFIFQNLNQNKCGKIPIPIYIFQPAKVKNKCKKAPFHFVTYNTMCWMNYKFNCEKKFETYNIWNFLSRCYNYIPIVTKLCNEVELRSEYKPMDQRYVSL